MNKRSVIVLEPEEVKGLLEKAFPSYTVGSQRRTTL
jgi:hypothetical protein